MALRIRQYVSFTILSKQLSAAEMTERIGLEPDQFSVMSRTNGPPRRHAWKLVCDDTSPDADLGTQISDMITRLRPVKERILAVTTEIEALEPGDEGCGPVLSLIRHLDDEEGVLDGHQHRLLGWYVEPADVQFLADLRVPISADEYGQHLSWWQWRARRRYFAPLEIPDDTDSPDLIDTGVDLNDLKAPLLRRFRR